MKQVRAAIVGMGIGRPNAQGIAANPRGRVVALCDLVEDRMADFGRELPEPVKHYTDYKAMCRDPEIDAVFIGTPNQWHVPIALEAVKHDKHVLITKPLADSLPAAQKLVATAEASGVVNMMSLSTRFDAPCQYAGRRAREGYFGELYYARARSIRRSGIPAWNMGFIEAGGGAFRDMGVHVLDAAWWLLGTPEPLTATGVAGAKFGPRGLGYWDFQPVAKGISRQYASDDYAGGFIRFEGGAGLQVESFWASHQPEEFQIELFGTEAGARLFPLTFYRTENGAPADVTVRVPKPPDVWHAIAAHFIDCILDGVACQAPLRHGMLVQAMLEAVLRSAASGKEVRLGR
ncbi:MAG: Gfo/Idh/MocA family oxidoreductase [Armatimonadetes bacterium]|nr:Gfo/Idh/MocA family oxidoreductase [Armatimonadota bacterium]